MTAVLDDHEVDRALAALKRKESLFISMAAGPAAERLRHLREGLETSPQRTLSEVEGLLLMLAFVQFGSEADMEIAARIGTSLSLKRRGLQASTAVV